MFGLTSHINYAPKSEAISDFRNNYCGTCKTIGKIYGNKERLFLNHDVVFLSELLSEIENDKNNFSEISIYRCFNLPKTEKNIPDFLKFSAAVNILLAYYKVNDNAKDSKYKFNLWRPLRLIERKNFRKAQKILTSFGADTKLIDDNIDEQIKREALPVSFESSREHFQYFASATKNITGEVFKSGVNTIQKNEISEVFETIGENFGEIVYLIDALEDYEQDKLHNKFNPFRSICSDVSTLPVEIKNEVVDYVYSDLNAIQNSINDLPIPPEKKSLFVSRIYSNVSARLEKIEGIKKVCACYKKAPPVRQRIQDAIEKVRSKNTLENKNGILKRLKYPFQAIVVISFFVLFPHSAYAHNTIFLDSDACGSSCSSCCGGCCNSCCGECFGTHCNNPPPEIGTACYQLTGVCCGVICVGACCCPGGGGGGGSIGGTWRFFPEKPSCGCGD